MEVLGTKQLALINSNKDTIEACILKAKRN